MAMMKSDFDSMLALGALRLDVGPFRQAVIVPETRFSAERPKRGVERLAEAERLAEIAIFFGFCLTLAVLFVAISTPMVEDRQIWNDGLMALSIAQGAILGGAGLKLYRLMEGNRKILLRFARSTGHIQNGVKIEDAISAPLTSTVSLNIPSTEVGHLGGRKYVMFPDGSIEVDTLLGRRRFTSLDAAREFVGG
jgi:hypothetical protein